MTIYYFGVAGGLDDWEVKIADFGVLLGKDAKEVLASKFTPAAVEKKARDCRGVLGRKLTPKTKKRDAQDFKVLSHPCNRLR